MKRGRIRRGGFTLVELMVVIAIITVLIAIGLPVMSRAREAARRATCMANLHSIAIALRLYRTEEGGFPGPYDPVSGQGGLNALYPTHLDNRKALICPDDPIEDGRGYMTQRAFHIIASDGTDRYLTDPTATLLLRAYAMYNPANIPWNNPAFFGETYSSYNHFYNWMGYLWWRDAKATNYWGDLQVLPGASGMLGSSQKVPWSDSIAFWYEWNRWDLDSGALRDTDPDLPYFLAWQVYWPTYDALNYSQDDVNLLKDALQRPLWDPADATSDPYGLPSAVFPGLINRNAPETAIVTRCPYHRDFTRNSDIVLRLDGSTEVVAGPPHYEYQWAVQPRSTH